MRSFPLIEFGVCLKLLLKSQDSATKLKISLFGFRKSSKLGRDLQYPRVEYGTPELEEIRFFNVKLNVVDVFLVFLLIRSNSRDSKRDGNNHGFQGEKKNLEDLMMDNSVKIWIDIRRGKEIVQKYVKKIKFLYVMI